MYKSVLGTPTESGTPSQFMSSLRVSPFLSLH